MISLLEKDTIKKIKLRAKMINLQARIKSEYLISENRNLFTELPLSLGFIHKYANNL